MFPVSSWATNVNIFEGVGHRVGQASTWHQLWLSHCDRVQMWWHFIICRVILLFFPSLLWWGEFGECVSTFNNKTGQYLFLFGVFKPTQDHHMCHPRNKTKGQTQRMAWIIACPQLEKHWMQLFSSHLPNRPRNTERSRKVFHCAECW